MDLRGGGQELYQMERTKANFQSLWESWKQSGRASGDQHAETFRAWLGKVLNADLKEKQRKGNWIVWESLRSVPAGMLVRRTLIACVVPDASPRAKPSDKVFREIQGCAEKGDILLLILIGTFDEFKRLAAISITVPCVALSYDDMAGLLFSEDHNAVLRRILHERIGVTRLNPYSSVGAVHRSMFFDRDGDINSIIGVSGKPVAVVGQRGIGKSSILRELARRVKEEPRTRAAYVDCDALESATPGALEQKLSELLFPRQARIGQYYTIDKFPLQTADSVYLFIDEVDRLVQYCDAAKNTSFYARLKAASTGNPAAAVVLAGWCDFWRAVRNPAHVLYRSFEVHQLGPLSEGDAEDLIVTPIESLGLRYDPREGIVSHIRNWSSCHPAHLQLFCERLVERASATRRSKITMEDIHAVEGDNSLYDAVAMPFIHTVSPEDKAVTYAAIHCGTTFTVTDIVERLSRNWEIPAKVNPVMNACERLVIANVFTRVGDRFKFLVNGFPGILRSRQPIDDLMRQMAEEVGRTLNA